MDQGSAQRCRFRADFPPFTKLGGVGFGLENEGDLEASATTPPNPDTVELAISRFEKCGSVSLSRSGERAEVRGLLLRPPRWPPSPQPWADEELDLMNPNIPASFVAHRFNCGLMERFDKETRKPGMRKMGL